jgi:sn-glycerol 3-phosphate transport system substrate-binding protein
MRASQLLILRRLVALLIGASLLGAACAAPLSRTEVTLRHTLDGAAAEALINLVMRFNAEQKNRALVRLELRADRSDSEQAQEGPLPQMALLDPADSMNFFGTRPRMRMLDDVMRDSGSPLAASNLLPQLADTVDDANGRLQALPLAMSLPVLFVNRPLLAKAGLSPNWPLRTWRAVQDAAGQLNENGVRCPLTSSHFAWIHVENLTSQSGEPMLVRSAEMDRLLINGQIPIKHLALLASWQKSRYFAYYGPNREGDLRFLDGECAMLTGASALYPEIARRRMDVAVMPLPYYDDVYGTKGGNTLPDGDSLWILAGASRPQEELITRFVRFLLEPSSQREWIAKSGFLPMTPGGLDAMREANIFSPAMLVSIKRRLTAPKPLAARVKSSAARERYRKVFGEELAPVWTTDRAPKEALDLTVQRLNTEPEMRNRTP